jgi:5,10-methylenetetrahydrofolate reductase
MLLGGVIIPERHASTGREYLRLIEKANEGCSFFISQCIYNPQTTRDFLSDYAYHCRSQGLATRYLIFTLTVCGSVQTLNFMKWLGISVPRWLENDLTHAANVLETSLKACREIAAGIIDYCGEKSIPFGFNIESVSIRKDEIEASITLTHQVADLLKRP